MFFRLGAGGAAKLEGGEAISVLHRIYVGGIAIQALPNHPAYLAVVIDPGAEEFRPGIEDKIPLHFFPDELELVMVGPDIIASAGNNILSGGRNIGCRPWFDICPYVPVVFEDTDGLSEGGEAKGNE